MPQGSILWSILFIIYVNDFCDVVSQFDNTIVFKLFADDAKFSSCMDNLNKVDMMQRYFDSVWHWALTWQLKLAVNKCKILLIGNVTFRSEYKLGDSCLPVIVYIKDLGVDVDNHLTFELLVTSIVLRANQRAAIYGVVLHQRC